MRRGQSEDLYGYVMAGCEIAGSVLYWVVVTKRSSFLCSITSMLYFIPISCAKNDKDSNFEGRLQNVESRKVSSE